MTTIDKAPKSGSARRAAPKPRASAAQLREHAPEGLITFRVSVLSQLLARLVDVSVKDALGLTSRQWRVLVSLNRLGPSSSGDVARMCSFDHSQVSRVAFELTELGLLEQGSAEGDRRKLVLSLTPAATALLRDGIPASMERQARLRARLGEKDYEAFSRALDALTDEAQRMLADRRETGGAPAAKA
jgi:DNA-binding MarR family transcriptional regulator